MYKNEIYKKIFNFPFIKLFMLKRWEIIFIDNLKSKFNDNSITILTLEIPWSCGDNLGPER